MLTLLCSLQCCTEAEETAEDTLSLKTTDVEDVGLKLNRIKREREERGGGVEWGRHTGRQTERDRERHTHT